MAFGPEISVERVEIDSSKAGAVYLAPFAPADAASHFPFHWEDPGYNYLSGKTPATLRKSTPDNFYHLRTDGPGKVAWGIWDGDTFAGCVDIANIPDYSQTLSVVLMPASRGRGIGTLATAGATEAAFTPGVLQQYVPAFTGSGLEMNTMIHPDNMPSRTMCERLGFYRVGTLDTVTRHSAKRWLDYNIISPALVSEWNIPPQARLAAMRRLETMAQFIVKI